jgi:hypothetical protein
LRMDRTGSDRRTTPEPIGLDMIHHSSDEDENQPVNESPTRALSDINELFQ